MGLGDLLDTAAEALGLLREIRSYLRVLSSPWLTVEQAEKYLRMGHAELHALVDAGDIPSYKRGKKWVWLNRDDLDAYMRSLPSGAKVPEVLRVVSRSA